MTFTATAPPTAWDYKGLRAFIEKFDDAIWVSIDKEGVDHLKKEKPGVPSPSNYEKLSEVGVATMTPATRCRRRPQTTLRPLAPAFAPTTPLFTNSAA